MSCIKQIVNFFRGGKQPPLPPIQAKAPKVESVRRQEYWQTSLDCLLGGKLQMLPHVYCIFSDPNSPLVYQALEACEIAFESLASSQIISFDEQFRQTSSVEWSIDWKQVRLQPVLQQCSSETQKVSFLGFGSFHPNGYYRQKCVESLADFPDYALQFLFLRLNDWVHQVRESAQSGCQQVMASCTPDALIHALPYLQKAQMGSRSGQFANETLRPMIVNRLRRAGSKSSLERALLTSDLLTRRMCYQLVMEASLLSVDELLGYLPKEHDPIIRLSIVKTLLQMDGNSSDRVLLGRLVRDKSPHIRVFVIEKRYAFHGTIWEGLDPCLLDSSARVREYVQFLYRKNSDVSLASFYRNRLDTVSVIPAILGLGETGETSDIAMLKAYLNTSDTKQVQAVLRAIAKLGGSTEDELYYQYLFDMRSGVAKRAFLCLRDTGCKPDGEQLYQALISTESYTTKKRLLQLIGNLSYWDWLYYFLLCVQQQDVKALAIEKLGAWHGTFLTPSEVQLERCRAVLEEAKPYLDANVYREFAFSFAHALR